MKVKPDTIMFLLLALGLSLLLIVLVNQSDPPVHSSDPNVGMFETGEYVDSLVSDKYAAIILMMDGSRITIDSVLAVGYDSYYVHVHKDPEAAITIIKFSDTRNIYYMKRGVK